ncbi:hypothetical protein SAMN06265360_106243 [Haloechinothrix alba]|uniref:Uncharacterized protein n=1 Tax=Haloechinothrix alba TaxID=664784 RepID=A0A238WJJ3_9PSEU|nr:hypothetical protein SAMN06265360_106243 [Haloechinothrix alba]
MLLAVLGEKLIEPMQLLFGGVSLERRDVATSGRMPRPRAAARTFQLGVLAEEIPVDGQMWHGLASSLRFAADPGEQVPHFRHGGMVLAVLFQQFVEQLAQRALCSLSLAGAQLQ